MWKLKTGFRAWGPRIWPIAGLALLTVGLASCGTSGGCVGITSCLTAYQLPAGAASAAISVDLDQSRSPGVQSQQFSIADNAEMQGAQTLAVVWKLLYPSHAEAQIEAGKRVYIRAHAKRPTSGSSYVACFNVISFIPQPGANYDLVQSSVGQSCRLEVRDKTTGLLAPEYQRHDANEGLPFFI